MNTRKLALTVALAIFLSFSTPAFAAKPGNPPVQKPTLTESSLRSCQARESAVKNRMAALVRLVTDMETKFDQIAMRVETFYTDKILPTGKTVSNYNQLLIDIQDKKTAVQTEINKAQTDTANFSCAGGDPKTLLNQFRLDMQATKSALKDYRTAINKLIVAVNSQTPAPTP